ncbi:MAG: phasin family protein [Methanosarcinaceae archaeon]|nr:phasin family protein [Methanosarcinaceae archaeon]
MIETIRKLGLLGIGAWALTEEKINEISKELVEKGEINKEEGKKFVRELVDEQKKQKNELESKISEKVKETFGKAGMETKEEIKRLEKKIDKLEKVIEKLTE